MTFQEFNATYFFHDSFITGLSYDAANAKLVLTIDFAFWMQDDFVPGDDETGRLQVTFRHVNKYECQGGDPAGSFAGILGTAVEKDGFVFQLADDLHNTFMTLKIFSDEVEVEKQSE